MGLFDFLKKKNKPADTGQAPVSEPAAQPMEPQAAQPAPEAPANSTPIQPGV